MKRQVIEWKILGIHPAKDSYLEDIKNSHTSVREKGLHNFLMGNNLFKK